MSKFFICYRRAGSLSSVYWLKQLLDDRFGEESVFIDDGIPAGVDWAPYLKHRVLSADVMLACVGPNWLTLADKDSRRRIDDKDDWVRFEIKTALDASIPIIPVLLEGATVPSVDALPDEIKAFVGAQAVEIHPGRQFRVGVDRLAGNLEDLVRVTEATRQSLVIFQRLTQEGDWTAAETALENALNSVGNYFRFTAGYKNLKQQYELAKTLAAAFGAFEQNDFPLARRLLDFEKGKDIPKCASAAYSVAEIGCRLAGTTEPDGAILEQYGMDLDGIVRPVTVLGGRVPGESQVRGAIARMRRALVERNAGLILEKTRRAIENGDWALAEEAFENASLADDDAAPSGSSLSRLRELRETARRLHTASEAFVQHDFERADEALAPLSGFELPGCVAVSFKIASIGKALKQAKELSAERLALAESELETVAAPFTSSNVNLCGLEELRGFIGRAIREAKYQDALKRYANGAISEAKEAFRQLADYRDAKGRLAWCEEWDLVLASARRKDTRAAREILKRLPEDRHRVDMLRQWCLLADRCVPVLTAMAAGEAVAEARVPWQGGRSPYSVLRVSPMTPHKEAINLDFDFQEKNAKGASREQREACDAIRRAEKRLLADFGLYAVRDPGRVGRVLGYFFGIDETITIEQILVRVAGGGASGQDEETGKRKQLIDKIAQDLGDDAGILFASIGNYDAAIERFLEQARRNPGDFVALHHLGLAACAKIYFELDASMAGSSGGAITDTWELVCAAWASTFADDRFWRAWWVQRKRVYPIGEDAQIQNARLQLQGFWFDEMKTLEGEGASADDFAVEVAAARAVHALRGIPVGEGGAPRATLGPRGASMVQAEEKLARWMATSLPVERAMADGPERNVCIGFSRLGLAQVRLSAKRYDEAIVGLADVKADSSTDFARTDPGFAGVPGNKGVQLFRQARSMLLQQCHEALAFDAVSEVPVDVDTAIRHWHQAIACTTERGQRNAVLSAIRDMVIGRSRALQGNKAEARLDALNDAVKLVQEAYVQLWKGQDAALREALVEALLCRAVYLSNKYDREKEARGDAFKAYGLMPDSFAAIQVLCRVSLYYAKELISDGNRERAASLLNEVEQLVPEAEARFPGAVELREIREILGRFRQRLEKDPSELVEELLKDLDALMSKASTKEEAED